VSTLFVVTSPDPGKHQPYHHGDLRNALVQAGVELAREGGPEALVLREVARRVGVSATAAYRHFSALPALIDAVSVAAFGALARSMETELDRCPPTGDATQDAWAQMGAVGRGYVHFALAEPGLFAVAFRDETSDAEPTGTGTQGLSPRDLLERALDNLVAAGLLSPDDRVAAATAAWAIVHGLSLLLIGKLSDLSPQAREAVIDSTLDLFGRGLLIRN
jgi:AcrR family transcriptional regulator